ncbi:MAG: cation-transporting P-type ATPase [Proteobacteria bacterium]|nr:MAG: cation-transporting P-type ATPase [Pseudomonadota bacterium]QKK10298.1 MAG: cation-translocating P-type ATPase [Pseudomonadota bacterium]
MPCTLCGLPTPNPPIRDDAHEFCCYGCREVYRCFGEAVFAAQRQRTPDAAPAVQGQDAYLWIDGMHCASCEFLIERIALKARGVLAAVSSYATSTAKITYDPDQISEAELPTLLNRSGYHARLRDEAAPEYDERPDLLRMLTGGTLASFVMMLSFLFIYPIHAGFAVPADYEAISWVAFQVTPIALFVLSTIVVFYVGLPILRGAWTGVRAGLLNMDCLVALSFLSAYGYSVVQLFHDPIDLYFEVASTLVAVVTIGRYLERRVRVRATQALNTIMQAWSPEACVRRGGQYVVCKLDDLLPGDRVLVRQGETIPVDGTLVVGQGAIDESLMTGEPFPMARGAGEQVIGGSVLLEGNLEIETGPQVESRMANLARILWNMQSSSAGVQGQIDRLSRVFVPAVLVLAALVGFAFYISGAPLERALLASLATLIVSCPCTFGLAIPLTTAASISSALHRGIIVTSADLFEQEPHIDIVAIDKTGTLSSGEMAVVEVVGPPEIAVHAAAVERYSPHPVAQAIARLDTGLNASDIQTHPGRGALGNIGGRRVAVGSRTLFATLGWAIPEPLAARIEQSCHGEGVVSYVGWDGRAEGAILTRDQSRPNWERIAERLRRLSRVVLLTGAEHPNGYQAHTDEVHAGVPPEAKAAVVRQLKTCGRVAMIGDGSNDAPALAEADLGIAFGAPTALAAEAADIVIPGKQLERVLDAFKLISVTRNRIRQNLGWALAYNGVAIPLAMTGYLNPLAAALAMSVSSILVVLNASRPILREDPVEAESSPVPGALSRIRFPA